MRDAAYREITAVGSTRKRIIIPAFSQISTWAGVSQMLARYSISNVKPFNLKRPFEQPNESFCAAISWNEAPYVYRYKLTSGIGEVLYFPELVNQQIGVGAYFEIWSVAGSGVAATTANWTLEVSKLVLPSLQPCLVNYEQETLPSDLPGVLPPNQYCNPFCFPLCGFSFNPPTPPTTFPLYWGSSTNATLNASQIIALANQNDVDDAGGTYNFPANSPSAYLYLCWPDDSSKQPAAGNGFSSGGLPVALAGASEGYANSENGWNYALVTVGSDVYRVYRTYYPLFLALPITVVTI